MVTSEREMVRKLEADEVKLTDRFTSLQPTYEDSVPVDPEDEWDCEDYVPERQ